MKIASPAINAGNWQQRRRAERHLFAEIWATFSFSEAENWLLKSDIPPPIAAAALDLNNLTYEFFVPRVNYYRQATRTALQLDGHPITPRHSSPRFVTYLNTVCKHSIRY